MNNANYLNMPVQLTVFSEKGARSRMDSSCDRKRPLF